MPAALQGWQHLLVLLMNPSA